MGDKKENMLSLEGIKKNIVRSGEEIIKLTTSELKFDKEKKKAHYLVEFDESFKDKCPQGILEFKMNCSQDVSGTPPSEDGGSEGGGGEAPSEGGGGEAPAEGGGGGDAPAEGGGGGEAPAEGGGEAPAEGGGEAPSEGFTIEEFTEMNDNTRFLIIIALLLLFLLFCKK